MGSISVSATTAPGKSATKRTAVVTRLDELLERSAGGDTAAFADLYDATARRAFGLAARLMNNRTVAAEDVVQEAYLTVWRQSARFDPRKGSSLGWILMIVHRTAVDHVRSQQARSVRDCRHIREDLATRRSDEDPTYDLTCASLDTRVVRAALAGLSLRQRQALELTFVNGCTDREVAELLGIPHGTAKSRIRDARTRMRASAAIQALRNTSTAHQSGEARSFAVRGTGPGRIGVPPPGRPSD